VPSSPDHFNRLYHGQFELLGFLILYVSFLCSNLSNIEKGSLFSVRRRFKMTSYSAK
jgi:hypothetical protein